MWRRLTICDRDGIGRFNKGNQAVPTSNTAQGGGISLHHCMIPAPFTRKLLTLIVPPHLTVKQRIDQDKGAWVDIVTEDVGRPNQQFHLSREPSVFVLMIHVLDILKLYLGSLWPLDRICL